MATNRLNLQIGGNREEPEEGLLEETGVSFDVDNLLEELVQENQEEIVEEHGDFLVRALEQQFPPEEVVPVNETAFMETLSEAVGTPLPKAPEPVLSRQERMAENLTRYNTKTNQSLQEVSPFSDGERIKLLEDAFAQMRRAQPATLVSGIGASLDSGGGAVWLWDLEDVKIGTPLNGTYPDIADGSFLSYHANTKSWGPSVSSQSGSLLDGGIIRATGGSANETGNLIIESTDGTNGDLIIRDSTEDVKFQVDGNNGTTTLSGGKLTIKRATTGSNLNIQGRTALFPQDTTSLLLGTNAASGENSDSIRYYGVVTDNNDITNKKYVDDSIAGLDPSGGFTFKGTCNVTIATDSGSQPTTIGTPVAGDFYINTTAGTAFNASSPTASNSWIGIAGLTIAEDQLIIYSGSANRWFAGSIEGVNPNVLKTGDTMTGPLTIQPASGTSAIVIKDVSNNTTAQIFSGGSATFNNTLTAYNANFNNVNPRQDDTWALGSSSSTWRAGYINTVTSNSITSGSLTVSNTIIHADAAIKAIGTSKFYHTNTNNAAIAIFDSSGAQYSNGGVAWFTSGNIKAGTYTQTQNLSSANTFGVLNVSTGDLTVSSGGATANKFTQSGGNGINNFIGIIDCTSTVKAYNFSQVQNADNNFAGSIILSNANNLVQIPRGTNASTGGLVLKGRKSDLNDGDLLNAYYNNDGVPDAVNYYGKTDGGNNIQTYTSVTSLISDEDTAWISFTSTSAYDSNSYARYRIIDGGASIQFQVKISNGGAKILANTSGGTTPTALRTDKMQPCTIYGMTKEFNTAELQFRWDNTFRFLAVEGGSGSQDIWYSGMVPYGIYSN